MFFRRYDAGVSDDTVVATSQVAIVEEQPPASAGGVQTNRPAVVTEVVNDRGEAPKAYLITSPAQFERTFGKSQYIGLSTDGYEGNLGAQAEKLPWLFDGGVVVVTVDAEAGEVTFTRPSPGTASRIAAANAPWRFEPGWTLTFDIDGAGQTATFDATAAIQDGAGGAFAGAVAGTLLYRTVDGGPVQTASYLAVAAGVAAAINELNRVIEGCHAENNGGQVRLVSDRIGTSSEMEIITGSTAGLLTELGLSVGTATTPATGDVADIHAVTAAEFETVTEADTTGEVTVNGSQVTLSTPTAGAGGSVNVTGGNANGVMGFTTGLLAGGTDTAPAGTIPAGTRVTASAAGKVWLTLEDLAFAAGTLSGSVRVRAAGGTSGTSGAGLINTVTDQPSFDTTFTVGNLLDVTAADLDTAYAAAAAGIVADASNQYARTAGRFGACRHTAAVQSAMTAATVARSSSGRGAVYIPAPPIGTNKTTAEGSSGAGVAAAASGGRSDRKSYAWPPYKGRSTITGTTALVDFPADLTALAILAHLSPEESVGAYHRDYMTHVVGLGADAGVLAYADYVSLKASGILALRIDPDLGSFFQDPVTTSTTSGRTVLSRRTMVDYIGDSLGQKLLRFKGQPFRTSVREDAYNDCDGFLAKLLRDDRIFAYTLADTTDAADRALGILRLECKVDLLGEIGSVVLQISASPGILEVTEVPAAA